MANDQSRPLQPFRHVSHGESFATAGDTEKCLLLIAFVHAFNQPVHCLRLVAGELEVGDNFEVFYFTLTLILSHQGGGIWLRW